MNKNEIIAIFDNLEEINKEKSDDLNIANYSSDEINYIFVNNVTLAFNKVQIDDNLRFYIDDQATSAIAIDNILDIV